MSMSATPDEDALKRQIALDMQEIRFWARQIQTPEQFERLIDTILDPAKQQEIKALLIPLLPFPYPMSRLDV